MFNPFRKVLNEFRVKSLSADFLKFKLIIRHWPINCRRLPSTQPSHNYTVPSGSSPDAQSFNCSMLHAPPIQNLLLKKNCPNRHMDESSTEIQYECGA